jgi:hypothetical protein
MSKNSSFRVHNESSQSERRAVLRNEREVGTYHAFATSEAGAVGGRYGVVSKTRVIGSGPVEYPALPSSSPWASDPIPPEPSFGMAIDAMEPVGTHVEIEQSLQLAELQSGGGINPISPPNGPPSGDARSSGPLHSGSSEAATSPHPKQKRRKPWKR